jgi:hypothetical protein
LHLLPGCEVGAERRQQACGRDACLGKLLRLAEEAAPVQVPMNVRVEKDEQFLVEVLRGQAWRHVGTPGKRCAE